MALDAKQREKLENSIRDMEQVYILLDELQAYCKRHSKDSHTIMAHSVIVQIGDGAFSEVLESALASMVDCDNEMVALGFKKPKVA